MENMLIKRISTNNPEYTLSLSLRDLVLRKPLGLDIKQDNLSKEEKAIHFVVISGNKVVGTLFLIETDRNSYQMKQVAVHPDYQGQSAGTKLVLFAEKWAQDNEVQKIWLHARINAWSFYQKLGFIFTSDEYKQVGIVHKTMEKHYL